MNRMVGALALSGLAVVCAATRISRADISYETYKSIDSECDNISGSLARAWCHLWITLKWIECGAPGPMPPPPQRGVMIDPRRLSQDLGGVAQAWTPTDSIPISLYSVALGGAMAADPPMGGETTAGYEAYAALYTGAAFSPGSSVTVRALPWDAALNPGVPMDNSATLTDPLWGAGVTIFSGGLTGNLDVSSLSPGRYICRVTVIDGDTISRGVNSLVLVPSPAGGVLVALGAGMLARRRR
jgi:hypothetical protein